MNNHRYWEETATFSWLSVAHLRAGRRDRAEFGQVFQTPQRLIFSTLPPFRKAGLGTVSTLDPSQVWPHPVPGRRRIHSSVLFSSYKSPRLEEALSGWGGKVPKTYKEATLRLTWSLCCKRLRHWSQPDMTKSNKSSLRMEQFPLKTLNPYLRMNAAAASRSRWIKRRLHLVLIMNRVMCSLGKKINMSCNKIPQI